MSFDINPFQLWTCHSIFALSLTRFAFRNPNGITCGYASFDLLLQNSSITKRCFVISMELRSRMTNSRGSLSNINEFLLHIRN